MFFFTSCIMFMDGTYRHSGWNQVQGFYVFLGGGGLHVVSMKSTYGGNTNPSPICTTFILGGSKADWCDLVFLWGDLILRKILGGRN